MVMLISSTADLTGYLGPGVGPSSLSLAYVSAGRAFDSVMNVTKQRISPLFRFLFFRVRGPGRACRFVQASALGGSPESAALRRRHSTGRPVMFDRPRGGLSLPCLDAAAARMLSVECERALRDRGMRVRGRRRECSGGAWVARPADPADGRVPGRIAARARSAQRDRHERRLASDASRADRTLLRSG